MTKQEKLDRLIKEDERIEAIKDREMKIVELTIENFMRVKAVNIKPDGNMVIISGKNDQGKTSVIDSIWATLKLKDCSEIVHPVRNGEKAARVTVDLGEMKVTRSWTGNDKTYLKVENGDGFQAPSPQALLDKFIGELSFNPLEFAGLKQKAQREKLLSMLDLDVDLDELDKQEKDLREERTLKGRELKRAQALVKELNIESMPEEEISFTDLTRKLNSANAHNQRIIDTKRSIEVDKTLIERKEARVKELENQMYNLRLEIVGQQEFIKRRQEKIDKTEQSLQEVSPIDISEIQDEIAQAQDLNEEIRAIKENEANQKVANQLQVEYDKFTSQILAIDETRKKTLIEAKMPIEGLGITEEGVTFNGFPFADLSTSEQLKVSMAIAMAMNPKLKVIRIHDGSLLDDDNLKIIAEMAKESDYQVWLEKVAEDGGQGFLIEDGELILGGKNGRNKS